MHVQLITARTAQIFHSRKTRGSRLRIAVSPKQFVIPASCLACCRTCPRTLLHDLSHLHHLPSDHLLPHYPVLPRPILDWNKKPCEIHIGVADTLNLHLPQKSSCHSFRISVLQPSLSIESCFSAAASMQRCICTRWARRSRKPTRSVLTSRGPIFRPDGEEGAEVKKRRGWIDDHEHPNIHGEVAGRKAWTRVSFLGGCRRTSALRAKNTFIKEAELGGYQIHLMYPAELEHYTEYNRSAFKGIHRAFFFMMSGVSGTREPQAQLFTTSS